MSPKSNSAQSKLDDEKRRRIAVTQIKTRIQALKFATAYREAWDVVVRTHGAVAVDALIRKES